MTPTHLVSTLLEAFSVLAIRGKAICPTGALLRLAKATSPLHFTDIPDPVLLARMKMNVPQTLAAPTLRATISWGDSLVNAMLVSRKNQMP